MGPSTTSGPTEPGPSTTTTTTATGGGGIDPLAAACRLGLDAEPTTDVEAVGPVPSEVSGVVAVADGAWLVEDSGNPPALHHLGTDGSVRTVEVSGVVNVDWEELIAADADHRSAWIADVGDNRQRRSDLRLHLVELPTAGEATVAPTRTIELRYGGGPRDVEAGVAREDVLYLFTKANGSSEVLAVPLTGGDRVTATVVGSFEPPGFVKLVTGAALGLDGRSLLVRTYLGAWRYEVADGDVVAALAGEPCAIPTGDEWQGEAIGVTPDGAGHLTIGEGQQPTLTTFGPAED